MLLFLFINHFINICENLIFGNIPFRVLQSYHDRILDEEEFGVKERNFDRKSSTLLANSIANLEFKPSPIRRGTFDLLELLSLHESIHRVLRAYKDVAGMIHLMILIILSSDDVSLTKSHRGYLLLKRNFFFIFAIDLDIHMMDLYLINGITIILFVYLHLRSICLILQQSVVYEVDGFWIHI